MNALQFADEYAEAHGIVNIIRQLQAEDSDESIAILVRNRNQLTTLVTVLNRERISFQGVEIDLLSKLPHINDVWQLTQALLFPAARLAWFAFLRSPWCGLTLADLLKIAQAAPHGALLPALLDEELLAQLSHDSQLRLRYIAKVMQQALQRRAQSALIPWLLATLRALKMDTLLSVREQEDLEQYWELLRRHEECGTIRNVSQFTSALTALYSTRVMPSRLQIMTIHKAKGLEFETVILPSLSNRAPNRAQTVLRWLRVPADTDDVYLVSPLHASPEKRCPLYDYIGLLDKEKEHYELQRLLYVAVTRAKKRLFLTDNKEQSSVGTLRHLLAHVKFTEQKKETCHQEYTAPMPVLTRLPGTVYTQKLADFDILHKDAAQYIVMSGTNSLPCETKSEPDARLLGIAAHKVLQWLSVCHPADLSAVPYTLIHNALTFAGFADDEMQQALDCLLAQLERLFACARGRWIIAQHAQEFSEYALLCTYNGIIETKIIDRTFVADGIRWVIDFKTGGMDNISAQKHRQQVNEYAALLTAQFGTMVRCGLYYLAGNHWVEWDYAN